jgi:ABC-type Mn2+/Zn2+ transport system permease subunit
LQGLFFKEFVLVSFDPEVARTLGYRASRWELFWYLCLGLMIAVSIHVAGTVLVFAYLVIPAVSALVISRRLGVALLLSVLFGILSTVAGVLLSVSPLDVPTSYAIVGCMVLIFMACWLLRTVAGVGQVKS